MGRKSLEVSVNPAIIRWARKSGGWSIEEISKKLKLTPDNYKKIESGIKNSTFRQLEMLANYFKRPIAVFFLPEPPEEPSLTSSFRILPKNEQQLSKDLRLAIRKTRYYQSISNELMKDLPIDYKPKITSVNLNDNPIEIARKERKVMGIGINEQFRWHKYEAFNIWRDAIESRNILVFQFRFPIEDARGFSLMDKEPPVIAINSSDNILARIFTLFHEYAHILLGITEIYVEEEDISPSDLRGVENWCNRFASEFLVPEEILREDTDFQRFVRSHLVLPEMLQNLSQKFKISRHAILTRLRTLNLIKQGDYERKLEELKQQPFEKKGWFIPPPQKCIQEKGKHFVSTVLQSKERRLITTADTIEYLSVKLNYLDKIQELIAR